MAFRQDAIGALGEALVCYIEAPIEARSKILPCDHGRELDQLFFAEILSQIGNQFVCGLRRRFG